MNLLILNGLVFLFTGILPIGGGLFDLFALHNVANPEFIPTQLVTHMFTHGSFTHLLFNMISLYFFGSMLERQWGEKRYFIFYMACGLGAGIITLVFDHFSMSYAAGIIGEENIRTLMADGTYLPNGVEDMESHIKTYFKGYYKSMIGASGAVFGLFAGVFVTFKHAVVTLFPIPIPIKMKYLFPFSMGLEVVLMLVGFEWDSIAHIAHLGGGIIGLIIASSWATNRFRVN